MSHYVLFPPAYSEILIPADSDLSHLSNCTSIWCSLWIALSFRASPAPHLPPQRAAWRMCPWWSGVEGGVGVRAEGGMLERGARISPGLPVLPFSESPGRSRLDCSACPWCWLRTGGLGTTHAPCEPVNQKRRGKNGMYFYVFKIQYFPPIFN